MKAVDGVIQHSLNSDVPLVSQVPQYIIGAGGRVRPALLLLTCGALVCADRAAQPGGRGRVHPHRDAAARRRGRRVDAAARPRYRQRVFGNAASVLVGDFLYSRAFQMMVDAGGCA